MTKTITIRGIASYPHFNTPDTKFNDKGLYHTKLVIEADAAGKLTKLLEKLRAEQAAETQKTTLKGKKPTLADLPIKAQEDEEGNETGKFVVSAKMIASGVSKKTNKPWSRQLPLFNAKGAPITAKVGGGSEVILSVVPDPYYNAKDKAVGVTLRLEGVQVVKLREFGAKDASGLGFKALDDGDDIPEGTASEGGEAAAEEDGEGYDF